MEPNTQFAPRVLLAIDDLRMRRTNEAGLRSAGFAVSAPSDADAAAVLAESFAPDVLVVDTDMHGSDDKPLYQQLRSGTDSYMLCIDAAGRDRARVELLRSGADDAVSVPVTPDEIAARCHALMRRPREMRVTEWETVQQSVITLGPLMVDTGRHEIRLGDEEVPATRIEFALLEHLCRRPTEVASRSELLVSVWGPNWVGDTHVVDVHLSNLRRKLDRAGRDARVIHTVRGVGFRISNEILDAAEAQTVTGTPAAFRPTIANGHDRRAKTTDTITDDTVTDDTVTDDTVTDDTVTDDTVTDDTVADEASVDPIEHAANGSPYMGSSIEPGTIIG